MQRRARTTALVENGSVISESLDQLPTPPDDALPLNAGFDLVDHPADVGIMARGEQLADAIAAAGIGMFSIMTDLEAVEPLLFRKLLLELETTEEVEQLVYKALNELLSLYGCEYFMVSRLRASFVQNNLEFYCWGEVFLKEKHSSGTEIKAITMHGLSVTKDASGHTLTVLFDI